MEKKFVNIGRETLAYLDEGQGEVVLMIHGNMSSSVHYEPLISRIKDRYRCIAVDLRGFGDSTYHDRFDSLAELAEDVNLLLEKLEIPFAHVDHPAAATMEDLAEADEVLGAAVCKNLLLCNRQCTDFYLLLLPGDKVFKTKELSKQIGSSRLSFAAGEYMEEFLDITPGSLSVMGLMNDRDMRVQLLIDADVLNGEWIGLHPCINTSSLRLRKDDLVGKVIPALGHAPRTVHL